MNFLKGKTIRDEPILLNVDKISTMVDMGVRLEVTCDGKLYYINREYYIIPLRTTMKYEGAAD